MTHRVFCPALAAALLTVGVSAVERAPQWEIVATTYPTSDHVIAGYNVLDFGADPTAKSDSTAAFQAALNAMHAAGGGTVFAPEGRYVFKANLKVPVSVTLRGEWREPTAKDPAVKGTLLMPLAGQNQPEAEPFITVDYCAGVKDLNIWYPRQSGDHPVPYPFCLMQKGGNNATFENLTLVNPYQGIGIGPGANELHLVRNVYGTPLKTGIQYDSTTDIGRLETIRFSPRWWLRSGLPKTPRKLDWIKNNGTAIHMLRSDWEYVADVEIDGYERGFWMTQGARGAANAQFFHLIIRDCVTAMEVEKTNPYGMVFTECFFEGDREGVLLDDQFDSTVLFSTCIFSGKDAIRSNGRGNVLLEQCQVVRGNIALESGSCSMLGSTLKDRGSRVQIGRNATGVILAGNTYANTLPSVRSEAGADVVQQADRALPLNPIPDYPDHSGAHVMLPNKNLFVVNPTGEEDTSSIQAAIDAARTAGGGTVFLSGGDYFIRGHIQVPSGVELRGIHDVPHHTMGAGSVLHIYPADERPTLTLDAKSGLRGLGFHYPEQHIDDVKPYPFLIEGRGENIHIINVNAANPYKFIDLMTHRCDNHYIDYASGGPLMTGIAVGAGSENGVVLNMQFNPHYWARVPRNTRGLYDNKPRGGKGDSTWGRYWTYQKENLDALVIGHTQNQFLYQNFVFGSLYGIHFTEQDGQGAAHCISHGHGTDGSKVGCYFEFGHGEITMINNELVAMSSSDKTAIKLSEGFDSEATLINTLVWGSPNLLAAVGNGTLTLQNLHAHRHGDGLLISTGALHAFNLNFNQHNNHITATAEAEVQLSGFVTKGPFQSSGESVIPDLRIER